MNVRDRIINILKAPRREWDVIAGEQTDAATLYKNYIIPLAAIPPVAQYIGMAAIGISVLGLRVRYPIVSGLVHAIVAYVLALVGVYVAALVIDWLAPKFQSQKSVIQALKLVAYSMTPMWIAGILMLVPVLGMLAIIAGLYGIYIFYLGVTPLMKTPADKVVPYMVVSAVVIIVIQIVIGAVVGLASPVSTPRLF